MTDQYASQPEPDSPPVDMPEYPEYPEHPALFAHVDTATLQRQHDALRHVIPGDPTAVATLAGIIRSLLSRELTHPGRRQRDAKVAADNRKRADEQAAANIKARQDAAAPEEAPAPPSRPYNPTQLAGGDYIP